MTLEKLIFIIAAVLFFILCASIYLKNTKGKKKRLFSASLISAACGLISLGAVYLLGLIFSPFLEINFCTVLFSALGSVPGVISMLFLNVI